MRLALERVNFRRIADALLHDFSLPVILASLMPDRRHAARFT
jgi:hypothetical protein